MLYVVVAERRKKGERDGGTEGGTEGGTGLASPL